MKSKVAFLLGIIFSTSIISAQNDPVIMAINGKPIYKSEFEYIYNKNNSNNALDKKSLDEYVDLFINFKLKVAEAEAQGIKDKKSYQEEFASYKNQLAAPYMTDKESEEKLIKEAYNRLKEEVNVSHILIRCSPTDTAAAYKQIYRIYICLRIFQNIQHRFRRTFQTKSKYSHTIHLAV